MNPRAALPPRRCTAAIPRSCKSTRGALAACPPADADDKTITPAAAAPAPAAPRTDPGRGPRTVRRSRLGIEISVALCVKLLLLLLLYELWFSDPATERLTGRAVSAALFGPVNSPLPPKEGPDVSGH